MMEVFGNGFICLCLIAAAGLVMYGWGKAIKWSIEETERAQLRASTAAAMRTDRHLAKLRRQKMRVQYIRRARVW